MRYLAIGWFAGGFAAAMLAAAGLEMAAAQGYGRDGGARQRAPAGYRMVMAESRFGNGTVRGAVRATSLGNQVQLPGGSWVYCRRSCSETLRAETVDFWEAQEGPAGKEQGLLIYLRRW